MHSDARGGFALIVAITLMAFILLLLLSLTSLLQVDVMSSQSQSNIVQARENARYALYVALGELQQLAGPDMRSTARGEIISTTGGYSANAHESKRLLTGVWDSSTWDPGDPQTRQDSFLGWLVSGRSVNKQNLDYVGSAKDPAQRHIPLAKFRGDGTDVIVEAEYVDLGQNGGYAWWVSDEGVKANIALEDSYGKERQNSISEDIARALYPHRNGIEATKRFSSVDPEGEELKGKLERLESVSGLSLFLPQQGERNTLMDDFTVYSLGVLSDQRRGGLKKDLSLALWRDPDEWRALAAGRTYTANEDFDDDFRAHRIFNKEDYVHESVRSSSASGKGFVGPRWSVLRDYHNAFQKLDDPESSTPELRVVDSAISSNQSIYDVPRSEDYGPTVWTNSGRRGSMHWTNSVNVFRDAHTGDPLDDAGRSTGPGDRIPNASQSIEMTNSGLYPLMTRGAYFFSFDMVPEGGGYKPRIRVSAFCNLWNPYNITLRAPRTITGQSNDWMMELYPQVRFHITRIPSGTENDPTQWVNWSFTYQELRRSLLDDAPTRAEFRLRCGYFPVNASGVETLTLRPGEIRQYSLTTNIDATDDARKTMVTRMTPFFPQNQVFLDYAKTGKVTGSGNTTKTDDNTGDYIFQYDDIIRIYVEPFGYMNNEPFRWYAGGIEHNHSTVQVIRKATETFGAAGDIKENHVSQFLAGGPPEPLGGFEVRMKPAGGSLVQPQRIFANANPRAIYIGPHMGNYADSTAFNWEVKFINSDPYFDFERTSEQVGPQLVQRGFWGPSDTASGYNFITLFDVPRRPVESIGEYQHAHLSIFPNQPTYAVGNSLGDPHINPQYAVDVNDGKTQMDLSWFLNDTLWDGYFLSTLRPGESIPQRDRFMPIDTTRTFDVKNGDYKHVAENLLLRGAFNVNSTSEEAWVALLSSLGGDGIRYFDTHLNSNGVTSDLENPIFRMAYPNGQTNSAWTGGVRDLNANQIRDLAKNIVSEVKKRGPFLSLSDFVNRRLESGNLGAMGALQAAIDGASINTVNVGGGSTSGSGTPHPNLAGGRQATFAPGWISQADILTGLGPVLTARSDTFVIRVYGEVRNPISGVVSARAWGEAVVQRTPEQIDPNMTPGAAGGFGRRFQIVDFRWLTEDEVKNYL